MLAGEVGGTYDGPTMPIIVACPSCRGQLRVADDLIGRKVRCPACSSTFNAEPPAPAAPARAAPEPAVETTPAPVWRNLSLELADDPPAPREEAAEKPNGELKGAIELDMELGDRPAAPARPAPESPAEEEKKPRRRWDDREEEEERRKSCPVCRRRVSLEATRCPSCGERLGGGAARRDEPLLRSYRRDDDEDDEDDYGRRRPARRDCEPHRGGVVLTLGIISVALLALFFCFIFPPIGLGCGIAAWWLGQVDMRKFRNGTMDPDGEGTTKAGWICGIIGTLLNAIVLLGCVSFLAWTWYEDVQRSKQFRQRQGIPNVTPKKF
jgi:predicted Zn finger-like uncharacterized protein